MSGMRGNDLVGMGESGNTKNYFRASLLQTVQTVFGGIVRSGRCSKNTCAG